MYGDVGRGLDVLIKAMVIGLIFSVPLALWKLWDIGFWMYQNINITWAAR